MIDGNASEHERMDRPRPLIVAFRSLCVLTASWMVFASAPSLAQELNVSPLYSPTIQTLLEKARSALDEQNLNEAQRLYQEAIDAAREYEPTAEHYIDESLIQRDQQSYQLALMAAREAVALDPENDDAWYVMGLVCVDLELYSEAREAYLRTLNVNVDHVSAPLQAWRMFDGSREYADAIDFYETLREGAPDSEILYYFLGLAYLSNGNHEQAAEEFRRAVELNPEDIENNNRLLEAMQRADNSGRGNAGATRPRDDVRDAKQSAVSIYRDIVSTLPDSKVPRLCLAKTLINIEQWTEAGEILLDLLRENPLELDVRTNAADFLLTVAKEADDSQQFDFYMQAAGQFERLIEASEQYSEEGLEARLQYSRALIGAGRYIDAINELESALVLWMQVSEYFPDEIYFELGLAHLKMGDYPDARLYFRLVQSSIGSGHLPTMGYIVEVHMATGDYPAAINMLRQIIDLVDSQGSRVVIDPDRIADFRISLARCLINTEQFDEAIICLRRLRGVKSHEGEMRLMLAKASLENDRVETAIEELELLEDSEFWSSESMTVMAEALIANGEHSTALGYLKDAADESKDQHEIDLLRADCEIALGKPHNALKIYEQVVDRDSSVVAAWVGLGDLEMDAAESKTGDARIQHLTAAISHYENAQVEAPSNQAVRSLLHTANDARIDAESRKQTRQERARTIIYVMLFMFGATIPMVGMAIGYRRQWARRMFRDVLTLERDLKQLIRHQVLSVWGGDWERLKTEEGFSGRFPYRYLQKKMAKQEDCRDVLDVSNFGHLVAIIDTGWTSLGFRDRSRQGTKELVVAALSYVGTCRNAIAHAHEMQHELGSFGGQSGNPLRHMNRQVRTSMNTIRSNLELNVDSAPMVKSLESAPIVEAVRVRED